MAISHSWRLLVKHNGRLDDCLTCEVIGNVHDDPELLEVAK